MKDLFGKALLDYYNNNYTEDLKTSTNISDEDDLPLPYLFRSFKDMPKLEQKALKMCSGKILDVGCGAGNHSLYLQKYFKDIHAIDVSEGAIQVASYRGVKNAIVKPLLEVNECYDTILLLMNGTGIFQTLEEVPTYLNLLKNSLKPGGQILIDSSDIRYMYEDEDGGIWIDTNADYYGQLEYNLSYKGEAETPMHWLYLDFKNLDLFCAKANLKCELVQEGDHFDYLAKITHL